VGFAPCLLTRPLTSLPHSSNYGHDSCILTGLMTCRLQTACPHVGSACTTRRAGRVFVRVRIAFFLSFFPSSCALPPLTTRTPLCTPLRPEVEAPAPSQALNKHRRPHPPPNHNHQSHSCHPYAAIAMPPKALQGGRA